MKIPHFTRFAVSHVLKHIFVHFSVVFIIKWKMSFRRALQAFQLWVGTFPKTRFRFFSFSCHHLVSAFVYFRVRCFCYIHELVESFCRFFLLLLLMIFFDNIADKPKYDQLCCVYLQVLRGYDKKIIENWKEDKNIFNVCLVILSCRKLNWKLNSVSDTFFYVIIK